MTPASGVPGDCYLLGKSTEAAEEEVEDEEEEEDGGKVLLHNGGFCSGCITKRILLLQAFLSTNIMQIMTKNITIFIYLIFYQREIVKQDHFMALSLSYANTFL